MKKADPIHTSEAIERLVEQLRKGSKTLYVPAAVDNEALADALSVLNVQSAPTDVTPELGDRPPERIVTIRYADFADYVAAAAKLLRKIEHAFGKYCDQGRGQCPECREEKPRHLPHCEAKRITDGLNKLVDSVDKETVDAPND